MYWPGLWRRRGKRQRHRLGRWWSEALAVSVLYARGAKRVERKRRLSTLWLDFRRCRKWGETAHSRGKGARRGARADHLPYPAQLTFAGASCSLRARGGPSRSAEPTARCASRGGMSVGAAHQPAEGRHVVLDGRTLTPAGVVAIARGRAQARVSAAARERNAAAERLVDELLDRGELLYGTSTGVGVLRSSPSALEDAGEHQWRLVRSHAGGGGAPLTVEVVRAAMAVRANQIGAGGAGIGEALLDGLLGMLRTGVTPFARELGSLGTGDLTVLAEIGVALGGEGSCWVGDDVVPTAEALAAHGLEPVSYGPRDGIGFMSSNAVSIGQAALVLHDATRLLDSALAVAALSYEAVDADLAVLDPRVHAVRPHHGQVEVARRLRELLGDFEPRYRAAGGSVHDAFVFRCVPQVEGTLLDAIE